MIGSEGGDHEALPGELHRGEQLAEDEEQLRGEHDAGEAGGLGHLGVAEARLHGPQHRSR